MPLSTAKHNSKFKEKDIATKHHEVACLMRAIIDLNINCSLKRKMLVHAVWEITTSSGNYYGRFRSHGTKTQIGVTIQRDHVFQKKGLVVRLLSGSEHIERVISDCISCTVTENEHRKLTEFSRHNPDIDGWDRYVGAKIRVFDMSEDIEMDWSRVTTPGM